MVDIEISDEIYEELLEMIQAAAPDLHSCGQFDLRDKIVTVWLPKLFEELTNGQG